VPRLGERRSILIGRALAVLAYVGYATASHGWMIYVAITVAAFGGIAMPACQSLITKSVRPDQQGVVQGSLTSVGSLSQIIGYPLGAHVFEWSIGPAESWAPAGMVYFTSAILCALGLLSARFTLRQAEPPAPAAGGTP
jgi:DHA1 family tetracycline resistance protein-like MFS transporter